MHNLNEQLFLFINGAVGQSHLLDVLFIFISDTFVKIVIFFSVICFALIPFRIKNPIERLAGFGRFGLFMCSLLIMRLIVEAIKVFIASPRPQQLLNNVNALSTFGNFDSFPSAHTAFAFAIATFVYYYSKSTGVVLFFLALLVGVSRVYVGVHFPLDILVGALIGWLVPWLLICVFKRSKV